MNGRLALLVAAFAACTPIVAHAAQSKGACKFVTRTDVEHVLGWHVDSVTAKTYDVQGRGGAMCFLESSQGVVTVMVPGPGSTFPGISAYNAPDQGLVRSVNGLGAVVALYNGTVYVTKHGVDLSVRVVPTDHPASYAEVQPFAKVVIRRMK